MNRSIEMKYHHALRGGLLRACLENSGAGFQPAETGILPANIKGSLGKMRQMGGRTPALLTPTSVDVSPLQLRREVIRAARVSKPVAIYNCLVLPPFGPQIANQKFESRLESSL